jgi:hypothetical protein
MRLAALLSVKFLSRYLYISDSDVLNGNLIIVSSAARFSEQNHRSARVPTTG